MSIRGWAVLWVALLAAMLPVGSRAQTHVPETHATSLTGTAVALPDALKDKVSVLVVGFSHTSQQQVASWGRLLAENYGDSHGVAYFELAMLAGAPKMLRGMIVKQMTSSVPYPQRPHFLPVMEGEPAWRAVAHYNKPDDAYVLIVDGAGGVLWQTEGEATDAAWAELKKNLAGLTIPTSAP
jgi:hypothetical protein